MGAYSFIDVSGTFAGPSGSIDLGAGAGNSDEGVNVVMAESKNTMTTGADGSVMHSLHASKSGVVTVNLLKTSPVNKKLSLMYNAQSLSSALWGNNVILLRNKTSGDIVSCRSVAFQKQPDWNNPKVAGIVAWNFDAGLIDEVLGEF